MNANDLEMESPAFLRTVADAVNYWVAGHCGSEGWNILAIPMSESMRSEADRLEYEQAQRAARDALVEEMARAGYEAVDEVLANGDSSRLRHWDSFTQGKEHHRIIARALLDDSRFKIERVENDS